MTTRLLKPQRKARACGNCTHFAPNGTAFVHRAKGGIYHAIGEQARGECRRGLRSPTARRERPSGRMSSPATSAARFERPETKSGSEAGVSNVVAFPSPLVSDRTPPAVEVIVARLRIFGLRGFACPPPIHRLERTSDEWHALADARAYAKRHGIPSRCCASRWP